MRRGIRERKKRSSRRVKRSFKRLRNKVRRSKNRSLRKKTKRRTKRRSFMRGGWGGRKTDNTIGPTSAGKIKMYGGGWRNIQY